MQSLVDLSKTWANGSNRDVRAFEKPLGSLLGLGPRVSIECNLQFGLLLKLGSRILQLWKDILGQQPKDRCWERANLQLAYIIYIYIYTCNLAVVSMLFSIIPV